jgi:hypothetical protein
MRTNREKQVLNNRRNWLTTTPSVSQSQRSRLPKYQSKQIFHPDGQSAILLENHPTRFRARKFSVIALDIGQALDSVRPILPITLQI